MREILPEFRPAPPMRVMDGCVLLAVVFALIRRNFTCYEELNPLHSQTSNPFAISRLT
ncbi:MAG: hypothetical protein IPL33_22405 [Sphingobacteriales bacterium]|nr:hypothetical protein [Sphingobacteriales bacterium]MBK8474708.1 hypothetical protein [Sphingobacteriales bacterium]